MAKLKAGQIIGLGAGLLILFFLFERRGAIAERVSGFVNTQAGSGQDDSAVPAPSGNTGAETTLPEEEPLASRIIHGNTHNQNPFFRQPLFNPQPPPVTPPQFPHEPSTPYTRRNQQQRTTAIVNAAQNAYIGRQFAMTPAERAAQRTRLGAQTVVRSHGGNYRRSGTQTGRDNNFYTRVSPTGRSYFRTPPAPSSGGRGHQASVGGSAGRTIGGVVRSANEFQRRLLGGSG